MSEVIRTLIVDDSAFVRKFVREMLSRCPYIEVVGAARDGEEALEMTEQLKPDVVTCDLTMPRLDGVGFVREQMSRAPLPILILTSAPLEDEQALEAMEAGAFDFVQKPTALANDQILDIREELVEKVKAASKVTVRTPPVVEPVLPLLAPARKANIDIVVIGISTGGPQALRQLIPMLPADFAVPICIVLHMPVGYTRLFAEKLNEVSALEVKEAKDREALRAGTVLIAQAGRHLGLRRLANGEVCTQLLLQPINCPHRPAADVLFRSAAEVYGSRVLAVVMTGMGSDGQEGAAFVKAQGGCVLTEAAESCVIYGMPRSVVESGLSDQAVPLGAMAQAIINRL